MSAAVPYASHDCSLRAMDPILSSTVLFCPELNLLINTCRSSLRCWVSFSVSSTHDMTRKYCGSSLELIVSRLCGELMELKAIPTELNMLLILPSTPSAVAFTTSSHSSWLRSERKVCSSSVTRSSLCAHSRSRNLLSHSMRCCTKLDRMSVLRVRLGGSGGTIRPMYFSCRRSDNHTKSLMRRYTVKMTPDPFSMAVRAPAQYLEILVCVVRRNLMCPSYPMKLCWYCGLSMTT
mmetsp:Transcript_5178/g.9850  ORF Transcript_5178/g.9850 Transcript_5178/m.9850 type:complete len:235 (+) Transcript_5178:1334-2038(+)